MSSNTSVTQYQIVNTIMAYFNTISDERIDNLIENCHTQLKIYQLCKSKNSTESIIVIFNLCHEMKITYLLPPIFYSCLCEAYDDYTYTKYNIAKLHGFILLV